LRTATVSSSATATVSSSATASAFSSMIASQGRLIADFSPSRQLIRRALWAMTLFLADEIPADAPLGGASLSSSNTSVGMEN